ncbi:MAG: lectin-like domain-containing protein [Myxococcota bacterium]
MRATLLLLPLLACSEYTLEGEKPDPGLEENDPEYPQVQVQPRAVELGAVCGGVGESTVTVSNVGSAPLNVRGATVTGDAWVIGEVTFPATLAVGDTLAIPVSGGPGSAVLTIVTDDPAKPEIEVPLSVTADAPPTATIRSPADGEVLPGSGAATFAGTVSDDVDAPEALTVAWASDVDGVLGTGPAAATGETTVSWDPAARTAGTHLVTLTATDSCGQTAESFISVCQDQGYTADDLDLATWHFEGSARWDASNGWVELTTPTYDQSGTAFQTGSTVGADNVNIAFRFYVSGGSGADGISLTALDTTRMTGFVGSTGGGIGYAGLPGWSIEVDTWYNGEYGDPTQDDHVSIHFDGQPMGPAAWAALPEMEDGAWHDMEVSVLAPHVTVTIDGVTYIDTDLAGFTAFPAYVGFTGATGGSTNAHLIDALTVTRYVCDE